jgi:hypothetical protein
MLCQQPNTWIALPDFRQPFFYAIFNPGSTLSLSTRGPYGPCGFIDTAVFSGSLYNSQGQEIRFNRYRTRQIVTKKNAPLCRAGEDEEYVFVLEKPQYADCVYIDFSPWTFGWSLWQPRSP